MSFEKIPMKTPLVEMDGDEMTRVIWQLIRDRLLAAFRTARSSGPPSW